MLDILLYNVSKRKEDNHSKTFEKMNEQDSR